MVDTCRYGYLYLHGGQQPASRVTRSEEDAWCAGYQLVQKMELRQANQLYVYEVRQLSAGTQLLGLKLDRPGKLVSEMGFRVSCLKFKPLWCQSCFGENVSPDPR